MFHVLILGAVAFLGIAVGIVAWRRHKKSCPLHQRRAGQAATLLAWSCAAAAAVLTVLAVAIG